MAARVAGFASRRAFTLAARYGARWVQRAGVGTARSRIAQRAAEASRREYNRAVGYDIGRGFKGAFYGAVSSIAAGGAYAAYKAGQKRPADSLYPSAKRLKPNPKIRQKMSTAGILYSRKRLGRKIPYPSKMLRINKANEESQILSFRGISPMDGTTGSNKGYFPLHCGSNVTLGYTWDVFPVHCYNLTATPNEVQAIDANHVIPSSNYITGMDVPWILACDTNGSIRWRPGYPGATNNPAVTTRQWTLENQTNTQDVGAGLNYIAPGKQSFLEWVSAKFMLYGKKKDDTRITVSLVMFPEDMKCPEFESLNGPLQTQHSERFNDAAESFVRPLVNNPIVTRVNKGHQNAFFKVLYSKTFVIPPKMTDDENDDPQKVQFNLFKRMNRIVDHRDPQSSTASDIRDTLAQIKQENWVAAPTTNFRAQPKYLRQNVYLLVYGWDTRTVPYSEVTSDYQCSYDLNLRKKQCYE